MVLICTLETVWANDPWCFWITTKWGTCEYFARHKNDGTIQSWATYKQVKNGSDWNRSSPLWVQWALQHWVLLCLFGAVMTNALQNSSASDRHRASMLPIRDSAAAKEKPSDWYVTNTSKLQYWSHKFHSLRRSVYEKNAKMNNLNGRGSKTRTNNSHNVLHIMLLEFHKSLWSYKRQLYCKCTSLWRHLLLLVFSNFDAVIINLPSSWNHQLSYDLI